MICGTSIFEVGSTAPLKKSKSFNSMNFKKHIPLKIIMLVGIPVLILLILVTGYSLGYFDNVLESSFDTIPVIENDVVFYGEYDSKCGVGTVLDPDTRACVPGLVLDPLDSGDSKCGVGTVLDPDTNACVLQ